MVVVASAPGRCGIVGNPSDIYGGVVVSCGLPARATCRLTVTPGEPDVLPDDPTLWRAAAARYPLSGVRVEWSTDVPRSSGLAGSTALLAATLACVLRARRAPTENAVLEDPIAFSELVRDIERHEAGVVCGYQDAYMVVHGGLRRLDFGGKHPVGVGPPGRVDRIRAPGLPFLLVTTGVERLSGSVHGPIVERWLRGDEEVRRSIDRIADLGRLGADALQAGDWAALGDAMNENHALVAALGGSGDVIDELVERCRQHGARGAKLAGAGLGGTVVALHDDPDQLEASLRADGFTRFLRPAEGDGLRIEGQS